MVDVTTEIIIERSHDEVSGFACNPDNAPTWYVNIKSADWRTPKTVFLGRQLGYL
jgi:hypothetical protein